MNLNVDQNPTPATGAGPDDLIKAVIGAQAQPELGSQQNATPPAEPEKIGGLPVDQFLPAFEAATGFKSIDEVKALREQVGEIETWKTKASELEAKIGSSPKFANQFVEKLNDIIASGADVAKINAYWQLANADLDTKSPLDILLMQKQMEHHGLAPDALKAYVLSKYGLDSEDIDINSLPAAKAAELQIEAETAKQKLLAERVKLETVSAPQQTANVANDEMRRVEAQQSANFWGQFLAAIPAQIPFSYEEDAEKGIPKYDFNFAPKPETVAAVKQQIIAAISENPNLFPKTEEGARQLQGTFNQMLQAQSMQDFQRAMFLDLFNSMRAEFVAKNSGPIPNQSQPQQRPQSDQKAPSLESLLKAAGVRT